MVLINLIIGILFLSCVRCGLPTTCSSNNNCISSVSVPNDKCNAGALVAQHEGCCTCAYADTAGIPTIGVGFCLTCAGAETKINSMGYNYSQVVTGSQCLNITDINTLFAQSLGEAENIAKKDLTTFSSQCCDTQNVIIDMAYNLGNKLGSFNVFLKLVNDQLWHDAALDLKTTKWCGQVKSRCTDDVNLLENGCPCFDSKEECPTSAACCSSSSYCCTGEDLVNFDVCCDDSYPLCCSEGGCCPTGYDICCTGAEKGYCCTSEYPVCCPTFCCRSGYVCGSVTCELEDGSIMEKVEGKKKKIKN